MIYKQNAPQILAQIKKSSYPLLIAHENPDGDTLGASLALAQLLEKENKQFQHFCIDKAPSYFNFLPKIENIISAPNKINLQSHDLLIALDCGDLKRTGIAEDIQKIKTPNILVNIDHHQSNDFFGHLNLVIPQASSTSEIMYNFFKFHGLPIDKYMATNLLTGILTDTMNFTNAATTTESLKIASELLKVGARLNQIMSNIVKNKNFEVLKLWGNLLDKIEYNPEYNFAYTTITQKDLLAEQISAESVDGLANFLSNLQDTDFILVLSEEENDLIKVSLRTTKEDIDVSQLAKAFNGGGHKKAAGFKIAKPSPDNSDWKNPTINAIINKLRALNSELSRRDPFGIK
ncbi:MAG: bifunctional oligoribonuclease/PAP phosphatase NrnA [Candidatus Parcubacteria bacterium]|nr:bifunctional oligoribonuclease/PAP phosphatase NrnA [Candidatus Parcubacteria bacterium]